MPSFSVRARSFGSKVFTPQAAASSSASKISGVSSSKGARTARAKSTISREEPSLDSSTRRIASRLRPSACISRVSSIRATWFSL
jgi:hypothetical protein